MTKELKKMMDKMPAECLESDYNLLLSEMRGYVVMMFDCKPEDDVKYLKLIKLAAEQMLYTKKLLNKESK